MEEEKMDFVNASYIGGLTKDEIFEGSNKTKNERDIAWKAMKEKEKEHKTVILHQPTNNVRTCLVATSIHGEYTLATPP